MNRETEQLPEQQNTEGRGLLGLAMRIGRTLVVAFAFLSFPSVLPWMVAGWFSVIPSSRNFAAQPGCLCCFAL